MTFNGTAAAGEFLTGERYMHEAFANGPSNWHQKNIQVILKTTMVAGATGLRKRSPHIIGEWRRSRRL